VVDEQLLRQLDDAGAALDPSPGPEGFPITGRTDTWMRRDRECDRLYHVA
jgi:hypothetical protein